MRPSIPQLEAVEQAEPKGTIEEKRGSSVPTKLFRKLRLKVVRYFGE